MKIANYHRITYGWPYDGNQGVPVDCRGLRAVQKYYGIARSELLRLFRNSEQFVMRMAMLSLLLGATIGMQSLSFASEMSDIGASSQFLTTNSCTRKEGIDKNCVRALLKSQATKYKHFIENDGSKLNLLDTRGQKVASFPIASDNGLSETDETVNNWSFLDLNRRIGYFLLERTDDLESDVDEAGYLLISVATGNQLKLDGVPKISPDNKRLVATTCARDAESNPDQEGAAKVFKIVPSVLTEEPVSHIRGCFFEADWIDEKTILLKGLHEAGYKPQGKLHLHEGKWVFSS